ncbi:hypothetical protein [Clostridium sp.]|uniref:hypothetical protein n=1 Tax=Clostridium sp. TaxID=1506 RepID=UPI003F3A642A
MKYVSPLMQSFSKEEVCNHVVVSATCQSAVCSEGTTFTCGTGSNYVHREVDDII